MMTKALITWGGWLGHEPDLLANLFAGWLRDAGMHVTVTDSLACFEDKEALSRFDLIVPIWTMSTIARELALNVTDETYRPNDFRKVPASMAGSDQVYICGLVIKRALLPKGHLGPGNDYGSFLLKCRVDLRDNQPVGVEHIGISWITPR